VRALCTLLLLPAAACAAGPLPGVTAPTAAATDKPAEPLGATAAASSGSDADGDGIPVGDDRCPDEPETYNGTDDGDGCPDAAAFAAEVSGKVYFDATDANVRSTAFALLDAIAGALKTDPDKFPVMALEGHAAVNERGAMKLSLARASAVRLALIERGVDPARLVARASGATAPVCDKPNELCWERARRVELSILPRAGAPDPGAGAGEPTLLEPRSDDGAAAKPAATAPAGAPAERVEFAKGSALLTPANLPALDLVAGFLKSNDVSLEIDGHAADNERKPAELAEARAAAVRAYLLACGVNPKSLVVRSHAATIPACADRKPACRDRSRRVELRLP